MVANALNRIISHGGLSLGHDAMGNVTNDSLSGLTYSYSSENLMTGVGAGWFLRYDPLMRLAEGGTSSPQNGL